jgi:hypothetical protein
VRLQQLPTDWRWPNDRVVELACHLCAHCLCAVPLDLSLTQTAVHVPLCCQ